MASSRLCFFWSQLARFFLRSHFGVCGFSLPLPSRPRPFLLRGFLIEQFPMEGHPPTTFFSLSFLSSQVFLPISKKSKGGGPLAPLPPRSFFRSGSHSFFVFIYSGLLFFFKALGLTQAPTRCQMTSTLSKPLPFPDSLCIINPSFFWKLGLFLFPLSLF